MARATTGDRPGSYADAWTELRGNTLRKTVPQLLVAVFYWSLVLERHNFDSQRFEPRFLIPMAAGFVFYAIVFVRVLSVVPGRFPVSLINLWLLFIAYTLWLGFALPVHRRDVREWLGWVAMASGLIALLMLVRVN
jgi:hypothetical protein